MLLALLAMPLASAAAAAAALLTPERMIGAPRPGAAVLAPNGQHALIGATQYSFERQATDKSLYVVSLDQQQQQTLFASNTSAGFFLDDEHAAFLIGNILYSKPIADTSNPQEPGVKVGEFPASVDNLRLAPDGKTLVFTAEVYDVDSDLTRVPDHDASAAEQLWGEVKIYNETFVRHWDSWINPRKRSQLFSVDLQKGGFGSEFRPLLKGTRLTTPIPPFGGSDDFSIAGDQIAFVSKAEDVSKAWHTRGDVYVVPLKGGAAPKRVSSEDQHGAVSSPAFSADGKRLAWLQMARDGYESDRNQIVLLEDGKLRFLREDWDRSPGKLEFSADGRSLYAITEEEEHEKLFAIDLQSDDEPRVVYDTLGVAQVLPLADGRTLLAASSQHKLKELYLDGRALTTFNDALADIDFGPEPQQITYPGWNGRPAHLWIHYPPGYDANAAPGTYALKVLVHGGPEGSWSDSWATRWNPAVFAAAPSSVTGKPASIVILTDPAGSTGFGQAYTEEIIGHWGDRPLQDVKAGVHHVLKLLPSIDPERVVAAGASYGGYFMNWLQGHNEDDLFKGLVCHDGVFNTLSTWSSTEELWFPEKEFLGVPWDAGSVYAKWNPANHLANWHTPMLVIHGGKDYRLLESEGLSSFNTLQRRGIPSKLLYFDKENHWVLNPRNSQIWYREVLGWLDQWSSGEAKK